MVRRALDRRNISAELIVDVGCGTGNLYYHVGDLFTHYVGTDVIAYEGFPAGAEFRQVDLDGDKFPQPDGSADVVVAVEVIENLENPRAFMRTLTRLAKVGERVVVPTPHQTSLLILLSLIIKQQFNAFQQGDYPAHITALLPIDLRRMATECGLEDVEIEYSGSSRIPLTAHFWPEWLSRCFKRMLSDNVLMIGRKGAHT